MTDTDINPEGVNEDVDGKDEQEAPVPRKRVAAKPAAKKAPYLATLVRGNLYMYLGVKYEAGEAVPIDAETKAHLEQHAVDNVTVEGKAEPRAKFTFKRA